MGAELRGEVASGYATGETGEGGKLWSGAATRQVMGRVLVRDMFIGVLCTNM